MTSVLAPLFLALLASAHALPTHFLMHLLEWMDCEWEEGTQPGKKQDIYVSIYFFFRDNRQWYGKGRGANHGRRKEQRGSICSIPIQPLLSCSQAALNGAESYTSQSLLLCGSFNDLNSGFSHLSALAKSRKAVNSLEKPCTLQGLQFVIALVCLCSEINFTKQTGTSFVCLCLLLPWWAFFPAVSAWSKVMHL